MLSVPAGGTVSLKLNKDPTLIHILSMFDGNNTFKQIIETISGKDNKSTDELYKLAVNLYQCFNRSNLILLQSTPVKSMKESYELINDVRNRDHLITRKDIKMIEN